MSEYGGQQQNLGQQNWQQPQQQPQYGMHPQGQSPQMLQQGVQNPRAPSPVMMQQMQMQNPNQGQMIHSSPPNMQMQQPQQMIISQGQPQPMNGHMQIQNGQQIQMPNGQPGTIVMTSQPQMQQQPRPQGMMSMQMQPPQHPQMMHHPQQPRHGPPMSNQTQLIQQQHAPHPGQPYPQQPGQQQQYMQQQPGGPPPQQGQPQFVSMQSAHPPRPTGMSMYGNPPQHIQQAQQQQQPNGMSPQNLGMRPVGGPPYGQVLVRQPVQVRVFQQGDPMQMQQMQDRGPQGMYAQPSSALRQALSHGSQLAQHGQQQPGQNIGSSPVSQANSFSDSMETSPPTTNAGGLMAAPPPAKTPTPRQSTPVGAKKTPSKPASKSSSSAISKIKTQPAATVPITTSTARMGVLLDRTKLESLMSTVDKNETLEDDVADALLQYVEEYVGNIISSSTRLARHRNATRLEAKDVKYVLQKEFNVTLPNDTAGNGTSGGPSKRPSVNAHQQRMALIEKMLKKP